MFNQIQKERDQLKHETDDCNATAAAREQRFQSAFVAWLAMSLGAGIVVMGACVLAGVISVSSFPTGMAVPAILFGLLNVVVGYRRLPSDLK